MLALGLASAIKGAIGFGLPLMAVPIVSSILDPRTAISLTSIPILLSNVVMVVRGGGRREDIERLAMMGATIVFGVFLGAYMLATLDLSSLSVLVGFSALVFVGMNAARLRVTVPPKRERYVVPALGFVSGVLGGSTNIFGLLMTSYLHAIGIPRRAFVFSVTTLFTVGGVTQVLSYWQLGLYSGPVVWYALVACIPTLIGTYLGMYLGGKLPPRIWNALVLTAIAASGLNLVLRGLWR
jgi:uncharacterized membrane protein YfcA